MYRFKQGISPLLVSMPHTGTHIPEQLLARMTPAALVPTDTFAKEPLYLSGNEPDKSAIEKRIETYWKPYYAKLQSALQAIKERHAYALLWDAHSIFSVVPRFFEGRLTDFNLGTADGKSCAPGIGETLAGKVQRYSAVLNGRFKGGYITRRYGDPASGVHAVQLELSEITYMDEQPPFGFREDLAASVRPPIRALLVEFLRAVPRPSPRPH